MKQAEAGDFDKDLEVAASIKDRCERVKALQAAELIGKWGRQWYWLR